MILNYLEKKNSCKHCGNKKQPVKAGIFFSPILVMLQRTLKDCVLQFFLKCIALRPSQRTFKVH